MKYLLESLADLDMQLKEKGGNGLMLFQGNPTYIMRTLITELDINRICYEQDCEPIWRERDENIENLCDELDVERIEKVSHTLWDPKMIIETNGGFPPLTYQMMLHTVSVIGDPKRPVGDADFSHVHFGSIPDYLAVELKLMRTIPTPEDFSIFPENSNCSVHLKWKGGERRALDQLKVRLEVEKRAFERGTYLPNQANIDLIGPPTSMSAALRFGCLSVRKFYYEIHDRVREVQKSMPFFPGGNHITGPLIWREYFYTMSVNNQHFGQMENNPICLDISWRQPKKGEVSLWKEGKTGIPIIDAAMRQLRAEGWLHHVLRNLVATFLTRTGLWISWEVGLQHFLKYLLDADWSVCAGNWMWVSSSAFEKLLDSSKCAIVPFAMRLDPSGEYIKRYVPELRNMPQKYIHQPWKAPIEVQEEINCIIGHDYPLQMVDLEQASNINSQRMKRIRDSIVETKPHVRPSNEDEIRMFFWIADEVKVH